jgi:hypothetical protein
VISAPNNRKKTEYRDYHYQGLGVLVPLARENNAVDLSCHMEYRRAATTFLGNCMRQSRSIARILHVVFLIRFEIVSNLIDKIDS